MGKAFIRRLLFDDVSEGIDVSVVEHCNFRLVVHYNRPGILNQEYALTIVDES